MASVSRFDERHSARSPTLLAALLLLCSMLLTAFVLVPRRNRETRTAGAPAPSAWLPTASTIITNDTLPTILKRASTPGERTVIFATFNLRYERILPAMRNLCWHLQKQHVLQHTLFITNRELSWQRARAAGIPAYLDLASPVQKPPFDQKHWLAARFLELGYSVVYMDVDLVVLGDLLHPLRTTDYDIQGLSDWQQPDLPPTGASWRDFRHGGDHKMNVTQSTGFWYARATPGATHFLNAIGTRQYFEKDGWEQENWNEMLPFFLWGMGDSAPPVKYRLLPHTHFCNIGVYDARKAAGLSVDQMVVVHAGFVQPLDKNGEFERLGMWHPDELQLEGWRHEQMALPNEERHEGELAPS